MSKQHIKRALAHIVTLSIVTIVIVGALLGVWQNVVIGSAAIGFYALFAFVGKVSSETTFKLALLCVGAVAALYIFSPEDELIETLGIYLYLLLTVGIVTACIETFRAKKRR